MRDSRLITSHLYSECLLFCFIFSSWKWFFSNFKIVPTSCYRHRGHMHSLTVYKFYSSLSLWIYTDIFIFLLAHSLHTHTHTHTHTHMTARLMGQLMDISFWLLTLLSLGFPGGLDGKESAWNAGDPGSIPGLGKSPGEGNGYQLQYSCLENHMDRGAGGLQSIGLQRVEHDSVTKHTFVSATVVIPSCLQILATNSNTGCLVIQVNGSA